MQKLKFKQLRGTYAQKLRHRIALGFTMGTLVVSCGLSYLLALIKPEPLSWVKNFEHPKLYLRKKGYVPLLETKSDKEIRENL
ncbi:uncharacterized protein TNIN_369491 [Trichonephila inaurata madagascariensis]|uniref:Uncharacterized protein n=1 Tax=Trichonephila inaurata madagascariensis TaxID=2747483 RepID=A0A8X6IX76_9ARAC|nr:uncharacterized protein TNIN_369491 [Trichonephila inaurata madagascariensis]